MLRLFQTNMKPWTVEPHFENNPDPCFMFKHALFHATKATGKVAGLADEHDHAGAKASPKESFKESGKYLADMVVCAMKMASEAGIDLQDALNARMVEKGLL